MIQSYIAIEEENNLVVNQYDSEDNIVKSEIIPENKGKYTSKAIKDTIEKVSSIYDENKPIKGQVDIEGNEVRNMKKQQNNNKGDSSSTSVSIFEDDTKRSNDKSPNVNSITKNNKSVKNVKI